MRYVTRTALAVRAHDGSWLLQYGFMAFSPDEIPTSPLSVETKSILAIRETTVLGDDGSAAIEAMLQDTASIQAGGHTLQLPAGSNVFENYHGLYLPRFPGPQRLPSITITRQGTTPGPTEQPPLLTWDLELKASAKPFDNFAELIGELGNPIQAHAIGNSAIPHMEITLAPPARISRGEIKDGVLFVDVVGSPALDRSKVGLALKLFAAKGTQVQREPLADDGSWNPNGTLITGSFSSPVPDVGLIQVFLTYDGELLGSCWARDHLLSFNSRSALHKAIDSDGSFVGNFFDDRNAFEEHVLVLLSLLRLDCLSTAISRN